MELILDAELISQNALDYLRRLRENRYLAEERLRKQSAIDKARWDSLLKNQNIQVFTVGDYVLMRHESKKGLEYNWMGPYKVIKRNLDFNTYQLQEVSGKIYSSWVHTDRLHLCKYNGSSINKAWYVPRAARNEDDTHVSAST
ncbi:hypothetical protein G6F37_013750 [Rhizopus arrhizus]|nr:hypothetical protein G6F38_013370 [Rhizopus arrhizus]KAG1136320.1 hypothetical protein G6F37_013750 [Rhizopus arrhizus]